MWEALTQYRIDACIVTDRVAYLIEVKPSANHMLLDQLWSYEECCKDCPLSSPSVKLVGLVNCGHPHVEHVALSGDLNIACLDDRGSLEKHLGPVLTPLAPQPSPKLIR